MDEGWGETARARWCPSSTSPATGRSVFGTYLVSCTALSTASRVSGATNRVSFSTCETVVTDTWPIRATSDILTTPHSPRVLRTARARSVTLS